MVKLAWNRETHPTLFEGGNGEIGFRRKNLKAFSFHFPCMSKEKITKGGGRGTISLRMKSPQPFSFH